MKIVSLKWFSAKSSEIWHLDWPKKSSLVATSPENIKGVGRQGRFPSPCPHGMVIKKRLRGFGNLWLFFELRNFLCRSKTNSRKHTEKGRLGFRVDRENTTGIGGDLLTESLHEFILKKTFVFHLSALTLPVL